MTAAAPPPDPKRKWYGLALRHLRMASRLAQDGFADGAMFHVYHAYECVLSAVIAANGHPVPPDGLVVIRTSRDRTVRAYRAPVSGTTEKSTHKARLLIFADLADRQKGYYKLYQRISRFLTVDARNGAIYYDSKLDQLPHQVYTLAFIQELLPVVRRFAFDVWRDIR